MKKTILVIFYNYPTWTNYDIYTLNEFCINSDVEQLNINTLRVFQKYTNIKNNINNYKNLSTRYKSLGTIKKTFLHT